MLIVVRNVTIPRDMISGACVSVFGSCRLRRRPNAEQSELLMPLPFNGTSRIEGSHLSPYLHGHTYYYFSAEW